MHVRTERDGFAIETDPSMMDVDAVHAALTGLYWSAGIPRETVARSLSHSLVFGVFELSCVPRRQIGLARVITDRATFAYLCDVYILEPYRGRGLSKWLIEFVLAHPDLQGLRRFCLMTRDAHGLYTRYGFASMPDPSRYLERHDPGVYGRAGARRQDQ